LNTTRRLLTSGKPALMAATKPSGSPFIVVGIICASDCQPKPEPSAAVTAMLIMLMSAVCDPIGMAGLSKTGRQGRV